MLFTLTLEVITTILIILNALELIKRLNLVKNFG